MFLQALRKFEIQIIMTASHTESDWRAGGIRLRTGFSTDAVSGKSFEQLQAKGTA
jgi:hypothetical protein